MGFAVLRRALAPRALRAVPACTLRAASSSPPPPPPQPLQELPLGAARRRERHRLILGSSAAASRRGLCTASQDGSVFATEEYKALKLDVLRQTLSPRPSDAVVDFSTDPEVLELMAAEQKRTQVVSEGKQGSDSTASEVVVSDFYSYSQRNPDPWIDRAVLVDPAYDIARNKLGDFFYGMFKQMRANGRLVLLAKPHDCSHYPFFSLAVDLWKSSHPPVTFYADNLRKAGFEVKMKSSSVMIHTNTEDWIQELKDRETFRAFEEMDEDEMEAGIEHLRDLIDGMDQLAFEEKFVAITATKPAFGAAMETLIVQEEGPPYGHCG